MGLIFVGQSGYIHWDVVLLCKQAKIVCGMEKAMITLLCRMMLVYRLQPGLKEHVLSLLGLGNAILGYICPIKFPVCDS